MGLTDRRASGLSGLNGLGVLPHSVVSAGVEAGLADSGQRVAVLAPAGSRVISSFTGKSSKHGGRTLLLGLAKRAYRLRLGPVGKA